MTLRTKQLALAAYLKKEGAVFRGYVDGEFEVDSTGDKSIDDWHVEYLNSCCHKHDTELVTLRALIPKKPRVM